MGKRKYRNFTEEELKVIKDSNKKINTRELAVLLKINYTNLTSMLKYHRVMFVPNKKKPAPKEKKESVVMDKKVNEKGQALLTDALMQSWFY